MRSFFRPRLPVRSGGGASWKAMAWSSGAVIQAREMPGQQGGGHVAAVLTVEAGSPVCALKEAVHALCPVFLLDVDQGLEFAQVMGAAGAVAPPLSVKSAA